MSDILLAQYLIVTKRQYALLVTHSKGRRYSQASWVRKEKKVKFSHKDNTKHLINLHISTCIEIVYFKQFSGAKKEQMLFSNESWHIQSAADLHFCSGILYYKFCRATRYVTKWKFVVKSSFKYILLLIEGKLEVKTCCLEQRKVYIPQQLIEWNMS